MKKLLVAAGLAGTMTAMAAVPAIAYEVMHISGGVGVAEQERLEARQNEFNLKVVLALNEGNYVAGANVVITDASGRQVIREADAGPFVMAKLPAGRYSIAATYDGRTVNRKVQVGNRGLHTEYLRWAANPQTDFAISRWTEERGAKSQERGDQVSAR